MKHSARHTSRSGGWAWALLLIVVAVCATAIILSFSRKTTARAVVSPDFYPGDAAAETAEVPAPEKNENSISVPGYEGLTLEADTKTQTLALENPAQNNCYFVITLRLEDGTELWQSDYIAPGENSGAITLSQPLAAGSYKNACLSYACYTLEDKLPLNGAEMKLTLRVQ